MPTTISEQRALLPSEAANLPLIAQEIRQSMPFRAKAPPPGTFSFPAHRCSAAASGSGRGRDTNKRERDENIQGSVYQGEISTRKTQKNTHGFRDGARKQDTKKR